MSKKQSSLLSIAVMAILATAIAIHVPAQAQFGGGKGKGGGGKGGFGKGKGAPAANLPDKPTAVKLPTMSKKITGPGPIYDSSVSLWPGRGTDFYNYDTNEYFIEGTANGKPYKTRLVIRQPHDNSKFSGLVLAESMHPAGNAHGFEYNSVYLMENGHIAADILTSGPALPQAANAERYKDLQMSGDQVNEILAQAGALIKSKNGPLAGLPLRKMILFGTSASSFVLTQYLPAHMVYRTPDMKNIYDGFLPTSNGSDIMTVDVPMIQVPTMHEYRNVATTHQDSDEAGQQFRSYEFAGMSHLDARHNAKRLPQSACVNQISHFPMEAYMAVALDHLFQWVDKGVKPQHATRVLIDRDETNDGSLMVLDEHGNPVGGIRSPYVDVPTVKYVAGNPPTPGDTEHALLCGLSAYEVPFSKEELRAMYGSPANYVARVEARLNELEAAGWSLPEYHDLIMGDAHKVQF